MEETRWKRKARYSTVEDETPWYSFDFDVGNQEKKYSDYFVDAFSNLLHTLRNAPKIQFEDGIIHGSPFGNEDWYRIIKGNLASLDQMGLLTSDVLELAREQAVRRRNIDKNENKPRIDHQKDKKFIRFAGAYYYPGVYIGDSFELSFEEKLYGPNILNYPKYEHKFHFGRKIGYFDKYGLVIIQCNSEPDSIKKLNLIFAISLIKGFPAFSVRRTDLIFTKISEDLDPLGQSFRGSWAADAKRFTPSNFRGQRKNGISLEQMDEIILDFVKVLTNATLSNYLLYLIESYTHLINKEFSQSYIYSWFIIEQDIAKKFEDMLKEKNLEKERLGKFKDPDKWSNDTKIELLNIFGIINEEEYLELIKCNTKRNKFVHKGLQIDHKDAESLYNLCFKIVGEELIKQKNIHD